MKSHESRWRRRHQVETLSNEWSNMELEKGSTSGFSTNPDGSWTAYTENAATTGKAETRTDAVIAAVSWLERQKQLKPVLQEV